MKTKSSVFLLIALVLQGCLWSNEPEKIPAYIRIKNFNFTSPSELGNNSQSISDVWVYVDGKINGIYELPCIFPVLETGSYEVKLYAGIYPDGMHNVRISYPFFTSHKFQATLVEKGVLEVTPEITYIDNLKLPVFMLEEFEKSFVLIEPSPQSDIDTLKIETDSLPYIGKYGVIYGKKDVKEKIDWASVEEISISDPGSAVFLEMHFKSTINFYAGVYALNGFGGVTAILDLVLLPRSDWRKIYVNLTDEIASQPLGTTFKILFRGETNGAIDTNGKPDYIALDNLKLLQMK